MGKSVKKEIPEPEVIPEPEEVSHRIRSHRIRLPRYTIKAKQRPARKWAYPVARLRARCARVAVRVAKLKASFVAKRVEPVKKVKP